MKKHENDKFSSDKAKMKILDKKRKTATMEMKSDDDTMIEPTSELAPPEEDVTPTTKHQTMDPASVRTPQDNSMSQVPVKKQSETMKAPYRKLEGISPRTRLVSLRRLRRKAWHADSGILEHC